MDLPDVRVCQKPDAAASEAGHESARLCDYSRAEDFEAIFRRYAKPLMGFLYGLIGDRPHAEELTQETFIRAFCNFDSRRGTSSISTWLFGIAHNVAREALRQRLRAQRSVELRESELRRLEDPRQKPDQQSISRELVEKIHSAVAGLPEDHRVVFILKMVHRLQYEDISSITGASIGKLKTDLHRARLEIRQRLRPYLGRESAGKRGGL
jgi:RNA polymerase sigma-70 factor, ECF subfamily